MLPGEVWEPRRAWAPSTDLTPPRGGASERNAADAGRGHLHSFMPITLDQGVEPCQGVGHTRATGTIRARAFEEETTCLPNGKQVTGMSLRFAQANGRPMIVAACATAVTT